MTVCVCSRPYRQLRLIAGGLLARGTLSEGFVAWRAVVPFASVRRQPQTVSNQRQRTQARSMLRQQHRGQAQRVCACFAGTVFASSTWLKTVNVSMISMAIGLSCVRAHASRIADDGELIDDCFSRIAESAVRRRRTRVESSPPACLIELNSYMAICIQLYT